MRFSQISLTAVLALVALMSVPGSTEAAPAAPIDRRPHGSGLGRRSIAKSYDQHRVVRVKIRTEDDLKSLTENENTLQFDYFTHHKNVGGYMDLRIAPEHYAQFQNLKLDSQVLIDNLQTVIDQEQKEDAVYQQSWEKVKMNKVSKTGANVNAFAADTWFQGYHSYQDHMTWLDTQIKSHSSVASSFSAGKTYQGRDQAGIKIGSGPNNVVLHGLQHSREWITGSVVEYIITQLLTGTDPKIAGYLSKYTFHIIPIMNPDGFVITQTTDRMHRKNAQKNGNCLGTDTNRNWDFHWNEGGATHNNPCADDYNGPSAFSTPEAKNIGTYLKNLQNVVSYIDFHSYSQLWMTPYGFTGTPPDNYDSYLKPLADAAVEALASVHQTSFTAGDIYNTIYPASGSSVDYALSVGVGAPFAVELRDTGRYGFNLPASQIIPSCEETWAAVTAILDNLQTN